MRRRFQVFTVLALLLSAFVGHGISAPAAEAATCGGSTCFGPGDAAWDAYYANPYDETTWAGYCAGGGATVVASAIGFPGCGPTGSNKVRLPSPSNAGVYTVGFQCVELVGRYMKVKKGWDTVASNGAGMARAYAAAHSMTATPNGTANKAPQPGDIISFSNSNNFDDTGHIAIVTASTVNGSGTGKITTFNENFSGTAGFIDLNVTNWTVATNTISFSKTEWLSLDLVPASAPGNAKAFPGANGAVNVSWTPSASAGTAAITGYRVSAMPSGAQITVPAARTTAWLTGAPNGVAQTYTVRAVTGVGDGVATAAMNVTPTASGFLRATTSPPLPSQISIDGNPTDSWGLAWMKLAVGSHQICFSHVEGYTEPACQNVDIQPGATTTHAGLFGQRGSLHVTTSPAVPSTISVDGVPRNAWGMWTDIPTGAHQVCFGAVKGFNAPSCQNVNVNAGQTTNVTGNFTNNAGASGQSGKGLLRVATSPAVPAQILINGVIADSWGITWVELAPGNYTVTGLHVEGYNDPAPANVSVTAGNTTTVTLNYVQRGTLRVQTSPAAPGTIYVDGIARDDYGMWTDLPTGSHSVCYGVVSGLTFPVCQTVTVNAGQLTNTTGTYT